MKKLIIILLLAVLGSVTPTQHASAQIPAIEVIKTLVKKVIKAIDLQVQKQQNKVIWLQNAQKTLENTMSQAKLGEITGWVDKQKELYQQYYDDLKKVKSLISYYRRIKDITEKQVRLVEEYKRAYSLFRRDRHFTSEEITYMGKVYAGIMEESARNMDQVLLVVSSFQTQMSDAKRLELINAAADRLDETYNDLQTFNHQGVMLSLQRSKAQNDIDAVKQLYGIR